MEVFKNLDLEGVDVGGKREESFEEETGTVLDLEQKDVSDYIYRLHSELGKSQLSIIANTSIVKLIILTTRDKSYLSEKVRQFIKKRVFEQEFSDYDTPFRYRADIDDMRNRERVWEQKKSEIGEDFMKENSMKRKLNKLLDD